MTNDFLNSFRYYYSLNNSLNSLNIEIVMTKNEVVEVISEFELRGVD